MKNIFGCYNSPGSRNSWQEEKAYQVFKTPGRALLDDGFHGGEKILLCVHWRGNGNLFHLAQEVNWKLKQEGESCFMGE